MTRNVSYDINFLTSNVDIHTLQECEYALKSPTLLCKPSQLVFEHLSIKRFQSSHGYKVELINQCNFFSFTTMILHLCAIKIQTYNEATNNNFIIHKVLDFSRSNFNPNENVKQR